MPIYLAAIGPKNLELAGEKCDGWLAIFFDPEFAQEQIASVRTGKERAGRADAPFDIVPTTPVVVGDDVDACADPVRGYAALYVGGMGSREQNFYNRLAVRMGYEKEAKEIQDLYLDRKYAEAGAAVPREFIDRTSLLGPVDRMAERMQALAAAGVTTLNVSGYGATQDERIATLRAVAEALDKAGVGD
jgi:alkanesulfonate monooxygenase SsuD/methylene tetrahydromethanopterin reductase-like flavin-dependent oxidoreductase (luciferase family)